MVGGGRDNGGRNGRVGRVRMEKQPVGPVLPLTANARIDGQKEAAQ